MPTGDIRWVDDQPGIILNISNCDGTILTVGPGDTGEILYAADPPTVPEEWSFGFLLELGEFGATFHPIDFVSIAPLFGEDSGGGGGEPEPPGGGGGTYKGGFGETPGGGAGGGGEVID